MGCLENRVRYIGLLLDDERRLEFYKDVAVTLAGYIDGDVLESEVESLIDSWEIEGEAG